MNNAKIVIDPGHGGTDPGAMGNGIIEKDLNLAISNIIYNRLKELGATVSITRETDITLEPAERVKKILSFYGNGTDVLVVSNHINASGGDGAEVIYALRNSDTFANMILEELERAGQNIRSAYQRRLPSNPSQDYYFLLRETKNTQPVIIEYGFLDSPGDDVNQLKNNYADFAEAVVRAIARYTKINYDSFPNTHVVISGDSLWSIAKKYNITVEELKTANNLSSNLLRIGQILKIPTTVETPTTGNYIIYTVKSGDTLYGIANANNLTPNELINYNNLSSTILQIGQQILIPKESAESIYIVQSGDTLYGIANKYNITVNKLKEINNLTTNTLSIGQQLKIKDGIIDEISPDSPYIDYTVKSGDNLYGIANKYNTSVLEIMNLNNLKSNLLQIGQILKIPTKSTTITYIVKSGDSLYSIANKNNTTVADIMKKNNLSSTILQIGQILII